MKDKIVIIGASGHGKVVADILNGYKEIIFLDDDETKDIIGKYLVAGRSKDIDNYKDECDCIIAIGNNTIREKIYNKLSKLGINQITLIHPTAVIDKTVVIEEGTVVMANAVLNADVKIGKGCIINTAATIDHDCTINDFVHISPGVKIAGTVDIGKRTWIGIGSSIINNLTICDDCIIGAGSTVIKDIKEEGTYTGSPVRKVR